MFGQTRLRSIDFWTLKTVSCSSALLRLVRLTLRLPGPTSALGAKN
jgi:hypothetical protein